MTQVVASLLTAVQALGALALASSSAAAQEATLQHDPIDCVVAGSYPLFPACFQPADQLARGRVYFQVEEEASWYYVEMKPAAPCWVGVLPKPTRALVNRRIRYYVEMITKSLASARTADHAALVVRSAEDCREPGLAAISTTGPAAVLPHLPSGFSMGGLSVPLVVAGAGGAVAAIAVVARPNDPGPSPTPTPGPIPPSPPSPSPTPPPTPSPSPSPSPTPAPGALSATCDASPQSGPTPLSVRFSVAAQGGTGTYVYAWAFGDGGTDARAAPTHVFAGAGDYVPTVVVTSGAEQVTCTTTVSVSAAPPATFPLSVSRQGAGSGVVTSNPPGISCGSSCTAAYPQGSMVSLSAAPDSGSVFAGWTGACTGTGACSVSMDAARSVSARFDLLSFTLRITKTPLGLILGGVTSSPAGVNCALLCASASASFPSGTVVTLTAQPILGSFRGWSGDCSGSGACVVTMNGDKNVNAEFSLLGVAAAPPEQDVDRGVVLLRSTLGVRRGRGEVTLNGNSVMVAREGEGHVGVRALPGDNLVEARLQGGEGGGFWQFDVVQPAPLDASTLRVLAGELTAVGRDSVTFRLSGRTGERVSFVWTSRE